MNIKNKFLRKIFAFGNKSKELEYKNEEPEYKSEELEQTTQVEVPESYVQLILLVDAFLDRGHYCDFDVDGHASSKLVHLMYKHALMTKSELKLMPRDKTSILDMRPELHKIIQERTHHELDRMIFDMYEHTRKWVTSISSDIYDEMVALYLPQIERVLEFDRAAQIDGLKMIYYTMKNTHLDKLYSLHDFAFWQRHAEIREQAMRKSEQDKSELECLRASLNAIEQSM